jgi:hypothetical protein
MYGKQYNNLEDSGNFRQKGILVQCDHLLNTTKQVLLSFWVFMCKTQKEDAVLLHLQTELVNAHNRQLTGQITGLSKVNQNEAIRKTQDMTHKRYNSNC